MKEDLTMTNKQMLVAQLRKEQEQNRILKKELERSARLTGKDVFVDAYKIITEQEKEIARLRATLKQYNTELNSALESLKSQLSEIEDLKDEIIYLERKIAIRDNALKDRDKAIEMLEGKQDTIVKQAQIDVLNKLKKKYGFYICCSWCRATKLLGEIIEEFTEEIKNE